MKAYLFFDNGLPQITAFIAETIKKYGHAIDIQEGANTMTIQTRGTCNTPPALHIPIPRPKKKVKKWQWLFRTRFGKIQLTACHYPSERDVFAYYGDCSSIILPVLESEIEVEE